MEHTMNHNMSDVERTENSSALSTYKPLILVGLFIIGITGLIELRSGEPNISRAMNDFMAGFFIFFSFLKLLNLSGFADAFSTYDVVASRFRAYALAYPFIELALGIAFALNVFTLQANALTILLMILGNFGVWQVLKRKGTIQCACLGTIFNLPMTKITLFENTLMLVMALMAIALH